MGPDVLANSLDLDDPLTHWSADVEFYIGCFLFHSLLPRARNAGPLWRQPPAATRWAWYTISRHEALMPFSAGCRIFSAPSARPAAPGLHPQVNAGNVLVIQDHNRPKAPDGDSGAARSPGTNAIKRSW